MENKKEEIEDYSHLVGVEKRCQRCKIIKPVDEMCPYDTFDYFCRKCYNTMHRERRHRKLRAEGKPVITREPREKDGLFRCLTCKKHKPKKDFSKSRQAPHGIQGSCKACNKIYETEKRRIRKEKQKASGKK